MPNPTQSPQSAPFETNFKKLDTLSKDLDQDKIPVDELIGRVRDGAEAAKACFAIIKETEDGLANFEAVFAELAAGKTDASSP
jgi:exonuclease VII small subunit